MKVFFSAMQPIFIKEHGIFRLLTEGPSLVIILFVFSGPFRINSKKPWKSYGKKKFLNCISSISEILQLKKTFIFKNTIYNTLE